MNGLNCPIKKRKQPAADSPTSVFERTFSQEVGKLCHQQMTVNVEEVRNFFRHNLNIPSAGVSDSQRNESGYKSDSAIDFLGNNFVPYKDPFEKPSAVDEFERKMQSTDLNEAAMNFMLNPNEENIFYPNFNYFEERLMKEENYPSLRQFIRQSLETEFQSLSRAEILKKTGHLPDDQISKNERCVSPDIFEDCEEIENLKECQKIEVRASLDAENEKSQLSYANLLKVMEEDIEAKKMEDKDKKRPNRRKELIKKIEKLISSLLEKMVTGEPVELLIRNTNIKENCGLMDDVLTLKPTGECTEKRISASKDNTKNRFSQILHILQEIYHLLMIETSCTLRELYYRDPELMESQRNVILSVQDICCLLEATPIELGIFSSPKGLIAGNIQIVLADDNVIDCSRYTGGILIPQETSGIKRLETTAKIVLLVEKDTVFERLLERNILSILGYDVILITGKGFPDINTRVMVKMLCELLKLPVYCLVDADPFGIEILMVYRYGSRAMSYNSDMLACSKIHWIGIHPSEIELLAIPCIPLTVQDKKRIKDLLDRTYISDHIKDELLILQRLGQKAEIEAVANFSLNYLTIDYIPSKIKRSFLV